MSWVQLSRWVKDQAKLSLGRLGFPFSRPADQPADPQTSASVDQRISGSADQRISGPADQGTSGSADQRTSGSEDQRISGSADQRISGPADQRISHKSPPGATNHWKNTVFCDFSTFSRACIFCLLTLSLF